MAERIFEGVRFANRRLPAPFDAALGTLVPLVERLQEQAYFVLHMRAATASRVVPGVLTMLGLSLTASLLRAFMDPKATTARALSWPVDRHMVFVVSGPLVALTDRTVAGHHER